MMVFIALSILTVFSILYGGLLYKQAKDHTPYLLQGLPSEDRIAILALTSVRNVSCFHCGYSEVQFTDGNICICPRGRGVKHHATV